MSRDHDWLALQKQAHREFATRLGVVTDWDAPTPDDGWSVRDLVSHVIEEQQQVPHLLAGRTVAQARHAVGSLGDDLRAEWRLYSLAAIAAWEAVRLDAVVTLSADTMTVADFLREQVSEVTIHAWDLARAIGAAEELDDDLVQAVWTVFEPQRATLSASGLYASPIPLPESAPLQSRLLALTGRDDHEWASVA
jgi:uncharacterized protein (TIGR03086 family)